MIASLLLVPLSRGQETVPTSPSNDALTRHVEELERQLKELRAEVARQKDRDQAKDTENDQYVAKANTTPMSTSVLNGTSSTQEVSASTTPSLAGLLGPTTLSGFVDVYYGQNFNNPASQTNSLRFFDGATNQFGLNLVELVVDKTPEVTNSRTGYHVERSGTASA